MAEDLMVIAIGWLTVNIHFEMILAGSMRIFYGAALRDAYPIK